MCEVAEVGTPAGLPLIAFSRSIASPTFECGRCLARRHHYGVGVTATTTLPHDFGRQLHNSFVRHCHGLVALGSKTLVREGPRTRAFLDGVIIPGTPCQSVA